MHAVARSEGIVSRASPVYNLEEMTYALKKGKARFLMVMPEGMEVAVEAAEKAGLSRGKLILEGG